MHNFGNNLLHIIYSLKNVTIPPTASVIRELLFPEHNMFASILSGDELSCMLNHIGLCCA